MAVGSSVLPLMNFIHVTAGPRHFVVKAQFKIMSLFNTQRLLQHRRGGGPRPIYINIYTLHYILFFHVPLMVCG